MLSIFILCLVTSFLKRWEWPWPLTFGYKVFTQYFCICKPYVCVNWTEFEYFFLDQNHLETPKVMTLTFDLENGKQPYLIKLWCILYLNAKFDGCILKTVYVANLYITLLQRRKKLQWPLVTLNFEIWSPKKNLYNPRHVLDISAKNKVDPPIGLGGVRPQTDTHRQTEDLRLL